MAFTFLMFPILVAIWGFILFMIVVWAITKFVTYIFQSFGLLNIAKRENYRYRYLAWVPGVCNYFIGKNVIGEKWSIAYATVATLKIVLLVYGYYFLNSSWMFYLILGYLLVYFIIDMFVMSKFYDANYKHPLFFLITTILTLGTLKSIYIFTSRFCKTTNQYETVH